MSRKERTRPVRRTSVESLEARQLMAVDVMDGLMDIGITHHGALDESPVVTTDSEYPSIEAPGSFPSLDMHDQLEQNLDSAHLLTGMDTVRENYGFSGAGQTVVVIDSGIAYDHYALGGGLGTNYRVVGGWDFTENDADPFDDGPDGFHGTHVAGIIGSTGDYSGNNVGVAPGVDLIGLRVFDDTGYGHFGYVSSALQWVIDNHDSFANPITAINLSLGTDWNGTAPPTGYSYIESKFQQIEALGIFISVSAGNSFTSYNTAGLSYPAASGFVVPVMSVDDGGALSYFSQRHSSAIAAPGRFIRSTIPDFAGNNNSVADDWASASGTSMAAPYVAGASVIIRQAMELVGYTNITQDVIYAHMRATADSFYDSATSQNYLRLNMEAAIDALMPEDDYGDSNSAYNLGALGVGETQVSGMISSLTDGDYFKFTASTSGVATFSATASQELGVAWDFGAHSATQNGNTWTMDVVAGQTYTVGLSTSGGLGCYDMDLSIESTFSFVDWGSIGGQQSHTGMSNTGENWYRVVAGQSGYVTAQAMFANAGGNVDIAIYNANMQMLAQSATTANVERVDCLGTAGQEFFIRVTGANADIDVQLTNMVSLTGSTLNVSGTDGVDSFTFHAGATHDLTVNGVAYSFAAGAVTTFNIDGGSGLDTTTMVGTSADEYVLLRPNRTNFSGNNYTVIATNMHRVSVDGNGGIDSATLYDTTADEVLTAYTNRLTLVGSQIDHEVIGFANTTTYATGGYDRAVLYDSADDDTYTTWSDRAIMYGNGFWNDARGFDHTVGNASSGYDRAVLRDSLGNDTYTTWWNRAIMYGDGYWNDARGFDLTYGHATDGYDRAVLRDSNGDDTLSTWWNRALMYSGAYRNDARGFNDVHATASNGDDRAVLRDSRGDDTFTAWFDRVVMQTGGVSTTADNFDRTLAQTSEGYDRAYFYDTSSNDTFTTWSDRVVMYGDGYWNDARGFDATSATATSGYDRAVFRDSAGHDEVHASGSVAYITDQTLYRNEASGFDEIDVYDTENDDADETYVDAIDMIFNLFGEWTEN